MLNIGIVAMTMINPLCYTKFTVSHTGYPLKISDLVADKIGLNSDNLKCWLLAEMLAGVHANVPIETKYFVWKYKHFKLSKFSTLLLFVSVKLVEYKKGTN